MPTEPPSDLSSEQWRSVDANSKAAAAYLDTVSQVAEGFKAQATAKLRLADGLRVIEVGCGLGRDAEEMARVVGPTGHVVGVDLSAELIARATERTAALGLPLSFQAADAQSLPFPDGHFDAARIERTLQHVPDPARAVRERVRIVKRGGRIVAYEPDWDTFVACGGEPHVLQAMRTFYEDRVAHAFIGRDTPHLLQQSGCCDISAEGIVYVVQSYGLADTVLHIESRVHGAIEKGLIGRTEGDAWLEAAQARDRAGSFVASINLTIVAGTVA